MPTDKFTPNSPLVAQVTEWVLGGTWEATDVITATINGKDVVVIAGSTTISDIVDDLVTALNASLYPEFLEITWSKSGTDTLVGTADTAGLPFTCTLVTTETGGGAADAQTIDGAASSTGTTTTANSTPSDWANTDNHLLAALPSTGDTIIFEATSEDVKYGLAQNAVVNTAIRVQPSFRGNIGLPETTATGYTEYRGTYLRYGVSTLNFAGLSRRAKIDCGATAATINVDNTGSPIETGVEALLLKGSSISVLNVNKGSVAVAAFENETSAVNTANIGYVSAQSSDAKVRFGSGCTLATLNMEGGQVETRQAITTATINAGKLTHESGAVTTLHNNSTVTYNSNGTIGDYVGFPSSVLDCRQDVRAFTITNCLLYKGAKILDPDGRITFTNPIQLVACGIEDVTLELGINITVAIAPL